MKFQFLTSDISKSMGLKNLKKFRGISLGARGVPVAFSKGKLSFKKTRARVQIRRRRVRHQCVFSNFENFLRLWNALSQKNL